MKTKIALPALVSVFLALNAVSYEFSTNKVFLRGVMGPVVNMVRYDAITSEASPAGGLMLGVEAEWVVTKPWALVGGFRPTFSAGFVDLGFSIGARYRWDDLGLPIILNTSLELTPAVLLPFGGGSTHFNIGLRPSIGIDYFLMRDLVIGAQLAFDPSWLVTERFRGFEASIEFLTSLSFKI